MKKISRAIIITGVLIILGILSSIITIVLMEDKYLDGKCIEIPNITSDIKINHKGSKQWHQSYSGLNYIIKNNTTKSFQLKIQEICSVDMHDIHNSNIYFDDTLVARTDNDNIGDDNINIKDCNGNLFASVRKICINRLGQGNIFETLCYSDIYINNVLVGLMDIDYMKSDDIIIYNEYGYPAVNLKHTKYETMYSWIFDIRNTTSDVTDLRILCGIVSKISFNRNNNNDICNDYIEDALIFVSICIGIVALIGIHAVYLACAYRTLSRWRKQDEGYELLWVA